MVEADEKLQKYFSQIERFEHNPTVIAVLTGDTTFEREVEVFYDMTTSLKAIPRVGIVREFSLNEDGSSKSGKRPYDLARILGGFCKDPLDDWKLEYSSVREDYCRHNKLSRKIARVTTGAGGFILGASGFAGALISGLNGDYDTSISCGFLGLGGLGTMSWTHLAFPEPKGTNNELAEFVKLCNAAEKADDFIDNHYKNHFIRKAIMNSLSEIP